MDFKNMADNCVFIFYTTESKKNRSKRVSSKELNY